MGLGRGRATGLLYMSRTFVSVAPVRTGLAGRRDGPLHHRDALNLSSALRLSKDSPQFFPPTQPLAAGEKKKPAILFPWTFQESSDRNEKVPSTFT